MIVTCKKIDYIDGSIEESSYDITEEQMNVVVSILDDLCNQCEDNANSISNQGNSIQDKKA